MNNEKTQLGQPATVGELKSLLQWYRDDLQLVLRNGPLPVFYTHILYGQPCIEIEIPNLTENTPALASDSQKQVVGTPNRKED